MNDRRRSAAERVYALLLFFYPRPFRDRFELQLIELFRDKHRAAAARGPLARVAFWLRIARDAVASGVAERSANVSRPRIEGALMEGFLQDVRYALRMVARKPALSALIVVTLALGLGANTAIFSVVYTVLLRPQPYADAERLVRVWEQRPEQGPRPVSAANFFDWKARATVFEDIAWSRDGMFALTGDGEPESLIGYRFSANMFSVLGVQPALGRVFTAEEDTAGGPRVAILSDKLWKRRFAGDRGVLGRTITLNGQPFTVIGVMPPEFKHPARTEVWVPIALSPQLAANRNAFILRLVGRMRPGVTREQVQAEITSIYRDLAARHPETNKGMTAQVEAFGHTGDAKPLLLVLFAGVGFVLLIACVNVANLLLADATSRQRELAVRSALGATRYRVARQMLTESLILSAAGGLLGVLVTWWLRDGLVALFPANIFNLNLPVVERIDVGPVVFGFAALVSLGTGLLFGMLPAWNVTRGTSLQTTLRSGDRGSSSRRTHAALVVTEVALSIVLLAGALLMVQSFVRVQKLDLGFNPEPVLSGRVLLSASRYAERVKVESFIRELLPKLQAIPGVDSAGIVQYLPLSGWSGAFTFAIEGRPPGVGAERPSAGAQLASEDYFRTMGIRIVSGRVFTSRDDANAPRVAVINEALARRYWPGENPVGRRVIVDLGQTLGQLPHEIVGIIGDVRSAGLEEPAETELYLPLRQNASALLCMTLRTSGDPSSLANQMRAAVWSIDREQPVMFVMPLAELAAESVAFRRAGMMLAGGFALLAVVLAAIGIYGVLSYSVNRRTREIGVRMALGATHREVARLVVRQGLVMAGIGVAIGLGAAFLLTRYLQAVLFEVKPGDPLTFVAVAVALMGVALVATWLPAWRATRVDPLDALRAE